MTRARDLANIADGTFTATDLDLSGTLTVSGDANFDSGTLFVDVSANAVGIGTSSPQSVTNYTVLEVGADNIGSMLVLDGSTSGQYHRIFNNDQLLVIDADPGNVTASTAITFKTDNSEAMRITSAGNVGIGTTSPSAGAVGGKVLHVQNSGGNSSVRVDRSDAATAGTLSLTSGNTTNALYSTGSKPLDFYTNSAETMRITPAGDVLVGTTSATFVSTGRKCFEVNGATNSIINLADESSGSKVSKFYIHNDASNNYINHFAANGVSQLWWTQGSERMRLDTSGALLVGTTDTDPGSTTNAANAGTAIGSSGYVSVARTGGSAIRAGRIDSGGAIIEFFEDGTLVGVIGSQTLSTNPELFIGNGANIGLAFEQTGSDRIFPCNGSTGAEQDATIDLGSSSARFVDAFIINGVTTGSDGRDKQDIAELDEAERRVAVACKGLLRKWRWKDAVAEKGDEARIHFGIIAQDLQAAFEAEGLDAGRYGMFIHSTWTDKETGEERSRMGVRYSELLAFIIAAL